MIKYLENPTKSASQINFGLNSGKLRLWLNQRLKFIWNPGITKFKLSQNLQKLLRLWNLPDQTLDKVRTLEQKQKQIIRPLLYLDNSFLQLSSQELDLTTGLHVGLSDKSSIISRSSVQANIDIERPLSPVAKSLISGFGKM